VFALARAGLTPALCSGTLLALAAGLLRHRSPDSA
jgi:hypothetical protein